MMRIATGTALGEAWAFVTPSWRKAWGALALTTIMAGASQYVARSQSNRGSPELIIIYVVVFIAEIMANGALYRLALKGDHPHDRDYQIGPAGMQWRDAEWMVFGATLIFNLIVFGVVLVVFLSWAILLAIMMGTHIIDPEPFRALPDGATSAWPALAGAFANLGGVISLIVLAAGLAAAVYIAARFILLPIAAVEKRRLRIGAAWSLSRGAGVAIIVSWVVILLTAVLVSALGGLFGGIASALTGAHAGRPMGSCPRRHGGQRTSRGRPWPVSRPTSTGLNAVPAPMSRKPSPKTPPPQAPSPARRRT